MRHLISPSIAALTLFVAFYGCTVSEDSDPDGESGGKGGRDTTGDTGGDRNTGGTVNAGGESNGQGGTAGAGEAGSGGAAESPATVGGAGGEGAVSAAGGPGEGGAAGGSDPGITVPVGGDRVVIWSDDFEKGFGDWSVEGGEWSIGAPTRSSNRPEPFSGVNVASTGLTTAYDNGRDARLISPRVTIPAAKERPRLRYMFWHTFSADDYAQLQIRVTGGEWQDLERFDQRGFHWRQQLRDLSEYAGQTVEFSFRLVTDAGGTDTGLFVDDVSVETGRLEFRSPEDFESGYGDWSVEGGDWAIGTPIRSSDRPEPYAGAGVATSGLNTAYGDNRDARLISPEFVVPAAETEPALRYSYWYLFADTDYAQLQIRVVGDEWEDLADGRFENSDSNWSVKSNDLSAYAGQLVQVAFNLVSNASNTSSGLFLDDVSIRTLE